MPAPPGVQAEEIAGLEAAKRRRQATHRASVKPELVPTEPNSVWSSDIIKLHGPQKWSWFHLYAIQLLERPKAKREAKSLPDIDVSLVRDFGAN